MPGVSLFLTDINALPDEIQKLLPKEDNENWFETYRKRFPNSRDKVLFIIQPSKARVLNALKQPFSLEQSDDHKILGNEFTFIVDPHWASNEVQSILNESNTIRLSLGMKENELTEIIPLQLNIKNDTGTDPLNSTFLFPSNPLQGGMVNRSEESRSVERTKSDLNKDETKYYETKYYETKLV